MTTKTKLIHQLLVGSARLTSRTAPVMDRLFRETLAIDDNRSYWAAQTGDYAPCPPLERDTTADLAIIGGGFTGVSTAYHFSRRYPEKRVVLLEAKTLGNGASGRNGGMMLNWLPLETRKGPETDRLIYETTNRGIDTIEAIIRRHDLPVSYRRDGTLSVYTSKRRAEAAHARAEYHRSLGIPSQFVDAATLARSLDLHGAHGAILDPNSGQINGAQYVRSLRPVLIEQGVTIYENTPVLRVDEGRAITLTTPTAEVKAKAVVLATNGYTGKLGYFRDALFPLVSHVFATEPLTSEQQETLGWRRWAGYYDDMDRIAYSTLTGDGTMVFGGGSALGTSYFFGNGTVSTATADATARAIADMQRTLDRYLPGGGRLPIRHRWTGTLGITLRRNVLMGVRGEHRNVYYAIGYCGHGVTLANLAGQVLTDAYSGDDQHWRKLPFYRSAYAPVPPEPFRWVGYQLFTRLLGKTPRAEM